MSTLTLFLPCAAGVEDLLADEVHRLTGLEGDDLLVGRGGVEVRASWREALRLNLWSRLAQRVLVRLSHTPYRSEQDVYDAAAAVAWEAWFTPRERFKIDFTAQHSPLKSLNFAALRVKDAVADRFRHKAGARPDVDTQRPDVRIHLHLTAADCTLYLDTSGEPLFKRGWREDKGEAPLKETLAAAMIAASGWDPAAGRPLYDPCCGSGTIAIEAAQIALGIAPGALRSFGFERLAPYQAHVWSAIKKEALEHRRTWAFKVFGSDIAFRMVDFAARNAERAGVAEAVSFRGGDALERQPPVEGGGVLMLNPPYGERIEATGAGGRAWSGRAGEGRERWGRERANVPTYEDPFAEPAEPPHATAGAPAGGGAATGDESVFFERLAAHWKKSYPGWTAWVLTPDLKLPSKMRLKESRRRPMWNGPIECRLFRFDMVSGRMAGSVEARA